MNDCIIEIALQRRERKTKMSKMLKGRRKKDQIIFKGEGKKSRLLLEFLVKIMVKLLSGY